MYRYAYIIVYKLNQGRRRRRGKHMAAGEGRMSRSTGGQGGNIYLYAYIIVYILNQGRRRGKDVPFHRKKEQMAAGEGRMSRSTGAGFMGEGVNIFLYAYMYIN